MVGVARPAAKVAAAVRGHDERISEPRYVTKEPRKPCAKRKTPVATFHLTVPRTRNARMRAAWPQEADSWRPAVAGGGNGWASFLGGDENILELVLTAAQFYECTDNTELSAWKGFDMLPFSQRRDGESTFHRLLSLPASLPSPPTFPGTLTRTAPI